MTLLRSLELWGIRFLRGQNNSCSYGRGQMAPHVWKYSITSEKPTALVVIFIIHSAFSLASSMPLDSLHTSNMFDYHSSLHKIFLGWPFLPCFSSWFTDSPLFWLLPLIRAEETDTVSWSQLILSPPDLPNSNSGKPCLEIGDSGSIYTTEMANYTNYLPLFFQLKKYLLHT